MPHKWQTQHHTIIIGIIIFLFFNAAEMSFSHSLRDKWPILLRQVFCGKWPIAASFDIILYFLLFFYF